MARRDQRGMALAVWTAVAMPALILMVGIGVDFSGHAAAEQEARSLAAQAARAATHEVIVTREGARIHESAARTAATAFVAAAGYDGSVAFDGDDEVSVTVTGSHPTLFLGLIGINEIPVRVSAGARAVRTVDGSEA